IDDDRIAFDPAAAHACIAALAEVACADFEPAVRYRETYCESPLRGRVRDGDACRIDEECASGRCLVETQGSETVRRCTPPIPHGGACVFGGRGCVRPEACQRGGTCGLGLPPGARCRSDFECIDHWCQGAGLFTDGTCIRACDGY